MDILLLADVLRENLSCYKKPFLQLTSELGLEYDTIITVTLKDVQTFSQYQDPSPFIKPSGRKGFRFGRQIRTEERRDRIQNLSEKPFDKTGSL